MMKKFCIIFSAIFVLGTMFYVLCTMHFALPVRAVTLDELNKQIETYQKEIDRLKNQGNTLSNQIAQFNAQIKLAELKISQTQEQIALLGGRIDQLEGSLDTLSTAFASRAVETYKISRTESISALILNGGSLGDIVTRFYYLKRAQEADRQLLYRLQNAQNTYKREKKDQEELNKKLEEQKSELNKQKLAKNQLLLATQNDEKKYQQLLSEAKAQLAAFRRFVSTQGGASILSNQTKCDSWGCYYNQRDAQWGNVGMGGSSYSVAEYGCLITSVSMMASHYGKNIKPVDIAVLSAPFVPGTGNLYHSFAVNGVNVTLNAVSRDRLDGELAAGRPVIAGLYSGPDHFIVILRKEGDKYVMYDPFLENGGQGTKYLTDKYSVSNITSLRLVSFN